MAATRMLRNRDVIDDAAATGLQIYGDIWALPSAILDQSVGTALAAKDALKHGIKRVLSNPSWNDDTDIRRDLMFNASRSRSVEELARIHKWAVSHRDDYLQDIVEARAAELGITIAKMKDAYPRGWNPKLTDRAYRYWGNVRHNPRRKHNPESGAARFFEKFHGTPSQEEIVIEQEIHEHEYLGVIGVLVAVVFDTPTGNRVTLNFDSDPNIPSPWLASNEDGTQLFVEGGNQTVDLKSFDMGGRDWYKERMILGQFAPPEGGRKWNIAYICAKDFDDFEMIRYEHDLGEPDEGEPKSARREAPMLEYEPLNQLLYITGGQYKINLPVFGTSPGIEN